GDAGPYRMPPCLPRRVAGQVLHQKRTRAHEAHVANQDVPQLRQLIEAACAQESPESGEPLVVWKETSTVIVSVVHGPKLHERKGPSVEARPALPEQHRRPQRQPHYDGEEGENGR